MHAWRLPPVVKAAMGACDVFISNSFDIAFEEMIEFKQYQWETKVVLVRNFAVTAPLLCTAWAQTPHELVSEIRYQASIPFKEGLPLSIPLFIRTIRGFPPILYGAWSPAPTGRGPSGSTRPSG
jgi:hypothetical protein